MLKRTAVWVSACSMLGALWSCGSTSDETSVENAPPVIAGLSADKDGIVVQIGTALLTVDASDPDGDALEFSWEVTLGAVTPGVDVGTAVLAAAPDRGLATVTVTATDGNGGEASETIDVGVIGWVVPESAAGLAPGLAFNAVSFADAENGVIVGGDELANVPAIYRYANGVWADETVGSAGHMTAVAAVAPNNMWTSGGGGLAFHFDGTTWSQFTVPGGCVHGIDFVDANDIWVTPAEGQPYMRRYTGGMVNDWESYTAPSSSGMNGVSIVSADDGWAVGNGGMAYRFNGTDWQTVDTGVSASLKQVDMITADDGWIVGSMGTILHWDGTAWTPHTTGATGDLNGVYAVATDDVWVVGAAGTVLHWDGVAWAAVPTPVTTTLTGVYFTSASDGWAAGLDSTILHLE
ncbi:MAG: hypothetical protein JRI68_27460 [Deltaproteobacteria bacterium]|nr:hypothetical protein [Deltaproteobacteria bacterium]